MEFIEQFIDIAVAFANLIFWVMVDMVLLYFIVMLIFMIIELIKECWGDW